MIFNVSMSLLCLIVGFNLGLGFAYLYLLNNRRNAKIHFATSFLVFMLILLNIFLSNNLKLN